MEVDRSIRTSGLCVMEVVTYIRTRPLLLEQFVEKPKPKQLLRPITTVAGSAMNQLEFLAIICNSPEAREKSRVRGAIGFGFDFHWLKNWRDSFQPITKRNNRNHVITFDSPLKTALLLIPYMFLVTCA